MKITFVSRCPYEDYEGEILNIEVNLDEGEIIYEGGNISIEMMDDSFLEREIKIINPKWAGDYSVISEKAKEWKLSGKTLKEAKGPGHYSIVVTDVPYHVTLPQEFIDHVMSDEGTEFLKQCELDGDSWTERIEDWKNSEGNGMCLLADDAGDMELEDF